MLQPSQRTSLKSWHTSTRSDSYKTFPSPSLPLHVFIQANIRALMGSETAILELMHGLDQAVREIGDMETKLEVYDQLLSGVRTTMASLGSQYSAILMENRNLQSLLREVDELVVRREFLAKVAICESVLCRPSWTLTPEWSTHFSTHVCLRPAASKTGLLLPTSFRRPPNLSCHRECPSCRSGNLLCVCSDGVYLCRP